ncbi:hypothetical protein BDQ17DRAFT_1235794, partial [Cyathus striatus]
PMSPADPPRPSMRRKSSAQNLLSSFKSNSSSAAQPSSVPPPLNLGSVNASAGLVYPSMGSVSTPTASTPLAREWDAQSLHEASGLAAATSPSIGQGTTVELLRDLIQKRIVTLTYIRNIHEGRSHWFHTILISRAELDKVFNNNDMKKRTHRFAILGLSLSTLLDINQPQDLLRGLLNTVTEFDQSKEESDKPKMRPPKRLFRPKTAKKGASGVTEYAGSYTDSLMDASYLTIPHMPFPLDYNQTLLSLLDVLSEVYNKIAKLLGPSPFPHSQNMIGPLGLLLPHPGVSYLFTGEQNLPQNGGANSPDSDIGSLWGIANAGIGAGIGAGGGAGSMMYGGALGSPPMAQWTPAFGETVLKIDSKLKKIITVLLKDLDTFARNGIRDELLSLDPLLRSTAEGSSQGNGPFLYDFEG